MREQSHPEITTRRRRSRRPAAVLAGIGIIAGLVAVGPAGAAAAAASSATLSPAWTYGIFTSGNGTFANSDSKLAMAIGGNGSLTSWSADSSQTPSNTGTALDVGGTLTTFNGGQANGRVFVGSPPITQNGGGFTFNGTLLASSPLNFSGELTALKNLANTLSSQSTTVGTSVTAPVSGNGFTLTLNGASGASTDVFNLTGAADSDLLNAHTIKITGTAAGATVLVNTDLASFNAVTTGLQSTQSGNTPPATDVVWNFLTATALTFSNGGWYGTVLAPFTTQTAATYSQFDGSMLLGGNAGTSTSAWNGEIESDAFAGCLPVSIPPLPQGLPLALGGGAIFLIAGYVAISRRRRLIAA